MCFDATQKLVEEFKEVDLDTYCCFHICFAWPLFAGLLFAHSDKNAELSLEEHGSLIGSMAA